MILHVFVVVFFNGFVLMLGISSVMRGLYALGVLPASADFYRSCEAHLVGPIQVKHTKP